MKAIKDTKRLSGLIVDWQKVVYSAAGVIPIPASDQLIITFHKQLLQGDVLIDDGVHNLEGGSYTKVLMTAPHNRSYDAEANGMIRVNNWSEAIAVVDRLAGK
jgi:5'(3')-deoxyribonucleotidase